VSILADAGEEGFVGEEGLAGEEGFVGGGADGDGVPGQRAGGLCASRMSDGAVQRTSALTNMVVVRWAGLGVEP
jgi:hypothetical protein